MTSQIVLMNKIGLAIASDSSLTMTRGSNRRTYASAEKIFPLGPDHKVAVLHSGHVEFMSHPYEVLISEWNRSLSKPFATLEDYALSFTSWLSHRQDLFTEESQSEFLEGFITDYLLEVRQTILNRLNSEKIGKDEWANAEVLDLVNGILSQDVEYLDGLIDLDGLNDKWADSRYSTLFLAISAAIEYVFDDVPRDSKSDDLYKEITRRILFKRIFSSNYDSRIALVGYGERDMYPSHIWIDFQGVVADKPRFIRDSIAIKHNYECSLRTHAQDEAIHTFLRAYHASFINVAKSIQSETIDQISSLADQNLPETESEIFSEKIESLKLEREEALMGAFSKASDEDFVQPFTSTLSGLPSTSLGKMAESLIALQILRQSSQAIQDTVGGPVDVAVITLDKGFQWFRHKTLEDLWDGI
jgi:hypothetical protein